MKNSLKTNDTMPFAATAKVRETERKIESMLAVAVAQGGNHFRYRTTTGPQMSGSDNDIHIVPGPWAPITATELYKWLTWFSGPASRLRVGGFSLRMDGEYMRNGRYGVEYNGIVGFSARIGILSDLPPAPESAPDRPAVAPLDLDELVRVLARPDLALWPSDMTMDSVMRQAASAIERLRNQKR